MLEKIETLVRSLEPGVEPNPNSLFCHRHRHRGEMLSPAGDVLFKLTSSPVSQSRTDKVETSAACCCRLSEADKNLLLIIKVLTDWLAGLARLLLDLQQVPARKGRD
jgi:hypothetical protein